MERHINIVGALYIGMSILGIITGIILFVVLYLVGDFVDDPQAGMILTIVAKVVTGFILVISIPGIIAGIGLFKRKEWARILTLIISVVSLINFPIGTAIGIYSIWALTQIEVVQQFKTFDGNL